MSKFLIVLGSLLAVAMVALVFPEGLGAVGLVAIVSALAVLAFRAYTDEKEFITNVFLFGLVLRLGFGIMVHIFELGSFFGNDAETYDRNGTVLLDYWLGMIPAADQTLIRATSIILPGWGMTYLTAAIYLVLGKSIFTAQSFCAVVGAATAPMSYFCAQKIFNNKRVSKMAAMMIAVFPSFIIWSSQLLKDGLIIFLLVTVVTMVLALQEKFNYVALILLILSLFGIVSLRFYIFYMVAIAVAGSFIIGVSGSTSTMARRAVVLILIGFGLTYLGVTRNATGDYERYASLERVQMSRLDLAQSAESGFGQDVDVSTTEGAISAIPLGLVYLMFAPFPWEMSNLRQTITLPEVLAWWAMIPLMLWGIWYSVKNRLRSAFPILFFSLMLTLAYSIFQGNVGTAYRQRTQIQVFLFIFIAVGWTLLMERREDKRLLRRQQQRNFEEKLLGI
ncbi:MAG: hypothetical protein ABI539_12425 [Acidobacteriota bacterium]